MNISENPSVDLLERQVKLLIKESESELRIDGVRVARGMNYNLDRISKQVGVDFHHFELTPIRKFDYICKVAEAIADATHAGVMVFEHAELIEQRGWGPQFSDTRLKLISKGWKIIYTAYIN